MGIEGKWKAVEFSGGAAFVEAIGSPPEFKEKLQKLAEIVKSNPNAYVEEIKVDRAAGTIHRIVTVNGEVRKDSGDVKVGVEIDGHSADGRPAKVKLTQEGDKLIRHDTGAGFSTVTTFHLEGDNLVATAVGGGATFVIKFHKV